METIDDDWESFLHNDYDTDIDIDEETIQRNIEKISTNSPLTDVNNIPKCSELYISTKTKIAYLNKNDIDIKNYILANPDYGLYYS